MVTPDWTRTSTAPVPAGTVAVRWASSRIATLVAATPPKVTCRLPWAPEKFPPVTAIVDPAAPPVALRPVTRGVVSTTSKSLKWSRFRPVAVLWMSLSSQVRVRPSAVVELLDPLKKKLLPLSATISP